MRLTALTLFAAAATTCFAQHWQLGGSVGYGFVKDVTVTRDGQSADTGFKAGLGWGLFGSQDLYDHLGGELRYTFRFQDLKISSGGTEYVFDGRSHVVHYDLLLFTKKREEPIRPFIAGGAGIKVYEGTGREIAVQPLSRFAVLTKTSQVKALISAGGGVRIKVSPRAYLRAEFRDYITPFPKTVIAPVRGSKISGWVHDIVPMLGISIGF